jgi:hypothetical protein
LHDRHAGSLSTEPVSLDKDVDSGGTFDHPGSMCIAYETLGARLPVDAVAFVAFVFLTTTGIPARYVLPPGSGLWATLWGLDRHERGDSVLDCGHATRGARSGSRPAVAMVSVYV